MVPIPIFLFILFFAKTKKNRLIFSAISLLTFIAALVMIAKGELTKRENSREKIRLYFCVHHLSEIRRRLTAYSQDNQGWYPENNGTKGLQRISSSKDSPSSSPFICPSITHSAAIGTQLSVTDYEYRGGLKDTEANADLPLAWDKTGNHKEFVNVLFGDGKILKMTQKELDALRKKYNR